MEVMHKRVAGLDVHKATVVACVMLTHASGYVNAKRGWSESEGEGSRKSTRYGGSA